MGGRRGKSSEEDRSEDMAFCYRSKVTQVLPFTEDSPLGREDGDAKRTGLRKWVPVAGSYSV